MAETHVIERTDSGTTIRTGTSGQPITVPHVLPILPIRNIVVFPGTVMPLNVGRQKSKNLLDHVMPGDKLIGVVTQKNPEVVMNPVKIAEAFYYLHTQDRSCWTHELQLTPFSTKPSF